MMVALTSIDSTRRLEGFSYILAQGRRCWHLLILHVPETCITLYHYAGCCKVHISYGSNAVDRCLHECEVCLLRCNLCFYVWIKVTLGGAQTQLICS